LLNSKRSLAARFTGVHLNWRGLRLGEASLCSPKLSYFSAAAAKKNGVSQAANVHELAH
jgi:hypothetical protein